MSGSLAMLWGLVNTLQLITHLPLYNINMPGNAVTFFSAIIGVTNFDIIPAAEILNWFMEFDPDNKPYLGMINFELMGYETTNSI